MSVNECLRVSMRVGVSMRVYACLRSEVLPKRGRTGHSASPSLSRQPKPLEADHSGGGACRVTGGARASAQNRSIQLHTVPMLVTSSLHERVTHLTESVARPVARKMSCASSGTFQTRHVLSKPEDTQRSCRSTSTDVTSDWWPNRESI
jgi:hypothetical protein